MAAAEGEAHRTAQMDRNAFHRALVTALSDPYTISGRATAEKLKALERVKGGREDSFVLDARYELGKRDDAYLQAPVLPLQTSDDDHEPLGLRLDPLFENAHRSGLYTALLGELRSKVDPDVERLASALRLAGWLMTMPEVYNYAAPGVDIKALERFNGVATAQEGQVAIDALVDECLEAFVPTRDAKDVADDKEAKKAKEATKTSCGVLLRRVGVICMPREEESQRRRKDAVQTAIDNNLCLQHGIHQLDDATNDWWNKKVDETLVKLFENPEAQRRSWFPSTALSFLRFKDAPTRRNLKAFLDDWNTYMRPSTPEGVGWHTSTKEAAETQLEKPPTPSGFAYSYPKATNTNFGTRACDDRPAVEAHVGMIQYDDVPEEEKLRGAKQSVPLDDTYAKWTPKKLNADKSDFVNGDDDPVAIAVSYAAVLEAGVRVAIDNAKDAKAANTWRLAAALFKVEQLAELDVCIKEAKADKFAGDSFELPVLRCRAIENKTKGELDYYKFKVDDGKLTKEPLAPADGAAKDFENKVGLRDLSNISMPASVKISKLRAIVFEGLDAFEELRCNEKEQDKMRQNLEELKQQRERLQDPDDPDDLVDTTARKRRRDVWSDGLREAALASDKLYAFARQLGGAIGEPISEVAIIDDSKLAAESKQLRDARRRASQRAAEQHADLVKNVIAQVIKDSQLQLGIADQGSSFAGTSAGAVDLGKLKVVSGALRREASDLAGLGKEGETDRFFGNAVKLESLLRSGTGEMSFSDLLAQLRVAGQQLQQATVGDVDLEGAASSTSIEYLSSPRNSLMLRWRPEALAAVREAFAVFGQEMRLAHRGVAVREIRAYELIEGRDGELTTLFATLCGLKMAANRLHSSSASMYSSQWAARNNNQQLRIALARVVRRACTYSMNGVGMGVPRLQHFR